MGHKVAPKLVLLAYTRKGKIAAKRTSGTMCWGSRNSLKHLLPKGTRLTPIFKGFFLSWTKHQPHLSVNPKLKTATFLAIFGFHGLLLNELVGFIILVIRQSRYKVL